MDAKSFGAEFIERISDDVLESTAVNHPYLQAMRKGEFPDLKFALKDFAFQYGLYGTPFISYLSAVIENLSNVEHRQILQANLAEEEGNAHDADLPSELLESVVKQSHVQLYRRFQEALGVDSKYCDTATDSQPGAIWSQKFLKLCEIDEYVGVGAIGIGTELIVSKIYNQILEGLKAHSNLTIQQRVFFDLHSECDDEHSAQLLLIAKDLADSPKSSEKIEYGAIEAIKLRVEFWDNMFERAQSFSSNASSTNEKFSDIGYQTSL